MIVKGISYLRFRLSRRYDKHRPNSRYSHLLEESEKREGKAVKKPSGNSPRNRVKKPFDETDTD